MEGRSSRDGPPVGQQLSNQQISPAQCAWQLLRELNIESIPIQPRRIAEALQIVVWEREMESQYDGCLMRVGEAWGILLNSLVQSESRKNFTIAHELGHFQLDRDNQTHHRCSGDDLHGFTAHQLKEQRANQFAAELLMPAPIFQADVEELPDVGLSAIDTLADRYATSLTSTAIRYTRLSQQVCAIVFSENERIKYFAYSTSFRDNNTCYLVKDRSLHPDSLAYRLTTNPSEAETGPEEVPRSCWCSTDVSGTLIEHSRRLPRINQIISFLLLR